MITLGIDLGSSSVKVTIFDADEGKNLASAQYPKEEMKIKAERPGFAEQNPEDWWSNIKSACVELSQRIDLTTISAVGISYQMHGLVVVDKDQKVLRDSIIWCDSRAVDIGDDALTKLGSQYCLSHLLNSPGNFTASKLKWVKDNEPALYDQIDKIMLPGDFVAMKLSGVVNTTATGMSEGVLWDYKEHVRPQGLLDYFEFDSELLPKLVPAFGDQGEVSKQAAQDLGLKQGIKIAYRAGDQPNNAFSLNVVNPGEYAATAGTSGVIYGVSNKNISDPQSRVNTFLHVNGTSESIRNGVLLCVNGTGILYSWIRKLLSSDDLIGYETLNELTASVDIGSNGLLVFPFGNGAERMLGNRDVKSSIHGLNFNIHNKAHLVRASKEGIVFALNYGFDVMQGLGMSCERIRAGKANLFLSPLFRDAFVNTTQKPLELYNTDGAEGAARGAAVGAGHFSDFLEAFESLECLLSTEPSKEKMEEYAEVYQNWKDQLEKRLAMNIETL